MQSDVSEDPIVSVIINCLNGERFLADAVESAIGQTFDNWEVIIWDNASTDNTSEIAKQYSHNPKIKYFRGDTTIPLSSARNHAFRQSKGRYIAILDCDDVWLAEKLERQVALFEKDDDVGLVYCDSSMFDDQGDRCRLFQTATPRRGRVFGELLSGNFIFTSTMMIRRTSLQSLDCIFDESYTRVQDYELSLRLAYKFKFDYVDQPLCRWRMYQEDPNWVKWKNSLIPRVVEVQDCVDKLVRKHPDIECLYKDQLNDLYKSLDYGFAINAWADDNVQQARRYLKGHLSDKKFLLVYLFTFYLKYNQFVWLKTMVRNNVTRRPHAPNLQIQSAE